MKNTTKLFAALALLAFTGCGFMSSDVDASTSDSTDTTVSVDTMVTDTVAADTAMVAAPDSTIAI